MTEKHKNQPFPLLIWKTSFHPLKVLFGHKENLAQRKQLNAFAH